MAIPVMPETSDAAFVESLRDAVLRYLDAVDAWETAYQRYYRLPGFTDKAGTDLDPEHRTYQACRRNLQEKLPRARSLCLRHDLRDPFTGLLHTVLGRHAPQHCPEPSIGRNERSAVLDCLVQLSDHCREWQSEPPAATEPREPSLLRRLVDYFC